MTAYKIKQACGTGEGDEIGLPAVPDDKLDDAIVWIHHHEMDGCVCMFCETMAFRCDECDTYEDDIDPVDEDHLIVRDIVLIFCEGYHTTALRIAHQHAQGLV